MHRMAEPASTPFRFLGAAAACTVSLALAACGGSGDAGGELPKRVVVITIDTLRFDRFTQEHMPETHGLFADGHVFTSFYSSTSTTQPTHASLLTGLHPWEHGVTRNGLILGDHFVTLPEALQDRGYWTSAVVTSYPLKGSFGYDQGFDAFDDEFAVDYSQTWVGEEVEGGSFYSLGELAAARAEESLGEAPPGPQFFWFHFFDPHDPYGDTPSGEGEVVIQLPALRYLGQQGDDTFPDWLQRARAQYDRDVRDLDQHLARVVRLILADASFQTAIILTADHGESFGEDGSLGHGDRVNSAQVHVPLAILVPGSKGASREDVAGTVDLAATVVGLAGIADGAFRGRNLMPPGSGGRPVAADAGVAFGMRRVLREEKVEIRLDGSRHRQSVPEFYAAHKGRLIAGDSDALTLADAPGSTDAIPDDQKIRALFGVFAASLEGAGAEVLDSDAAREALGVLGYGR